MLVGSTDHPVMVVGYERRPNSRLSLGSVVCWLQVADQTSVIRPSVISLQSLVK